MDYHTKTWSCYYTHYFEVWLLFLFHVATVQCIYIHKEVPLRGCIPFLPVFFNKRLPKLGVTPFFLTLDDDLFEVLKSKKNVSEPPFELKLLSFGVPLT